MIRLASFLAGIALLLYLLFQFGPANILSIVRSLGWKLLWIILIYGVQEMVRAIALWKSLPDGQAQP